LKAVPSQDVTNPVSLHLLYCATTATTSTTIW